MWLELQCLRNLRKKTWPYDSLWHYGDVSYPVTIASRWDQRPYVKLTIFWSWRNVQWVMALMVTDVGTAVVYGDLTKFQGERVMIGGLGGQTIPLTQMWLKRGVRHLPPWEYKVSMPKMYSGTGAIDILLGLALQTARGTFRRWQRCISVWVVKAIMRGHAKHEPTCLPEPHWINNVRQYRLWGSGGEGKMKY